MKTVKKEIYADMLRDLRDYGFRLYKGRLWKYDSSIGYVVSIEVDSTQFGTLNDIIIDMATYQEPLKLNTIRTSDGFYFKICLRVGMYLFRHEKEQIIKWENPYHSADIVMMEQYEALRPYLQKGIFPILMLDTNIRNFLENMEKIQQMECETYLGMEGLRWPDLAFEYFQIGDIDNALRIINANCMLYDKIKQEHSSNLPLEKRTSMTHYWDKKKKEAIDLAEMIKTRPEEIKRIIIENRMISENSCCRFFSSQFYRRDKKED